MLPTECDSAQLMMSLTPVTHDAFRGIEMEDLAR